MNTKNLLTVGECMLIESYWKQDWDAKVNGEELGDNTQRWYRSVLRFIGKRGDEVYPQPLLKQEARILELGLAEEYLAALREVVNCRDARSEAEHAVYLLLATPDQRQEAADLVLKGGQ